MAKPAAKREKKSKEINPHIFNMLRPIGDVDALMDWAKLVADGKNPDPNKFVTSQSEHDKLIDAHYKARDAKLVRPSVPAFYQPAWVEHAAATNARVLLFGQAKRHSRKPSDWPAMGGDWVPGMYIGKARRCHALDLRKLVDDPENNILKINGWEYLVGNTDLSAIFLINSSKTGNFKANAIACKKLGFDGVKGVKNLVGRFNRSRIKEILDDNTKPGAVIVWNPNQVIDWGYFSFKGEHLTPSQLRKMVEAGETDKISFEKTEPIVGVSSTKEQLWHDVKYLMLMASTKNAAGKTAMERFEKRKSHSGKKTAAEKRFFDNLKTQCRVQFDQLSPFGVINAQIGIPFVTHYGNDADIELTRMVIGVRVGAIFSENQWAVRARLKPVVVDKPVKKEKLATVAAKKTKKAAKPVAKKVATKKPVVKKASKKAVPELKISHESKPAGGPVVEVSVLDNEDRDAARQAELDALDMDDDDVSEGVMSADSEA